MRGTNPPVHRPQPRHHWWQCTRCTCGLPARRCPDCRAYLSAIGGQR